jgi:hypothetical protein
VQPRDQPIPVVAVPRDQGTEDRRRRDRGDEDLRRERHRAVDPGDLDPSGAEHAVAWIAFALVPLLRCWPRS